MPPALFAADSIFRAYDGINLVSIDEIFSNLQSFKINLTEKVLRFTLLQCIYLYDIINTPFRLLKLFFKF